MVYFQYLCNCDASRDMVIDQGILTNKDQLPVTSLNYGGSDNRFSWVLYKLGFLQCYGKAEGIVYPSEQNQNIIDNFTDDISELSERIDTNENDIDNLQEDVAENQNDIYSNDNDIAELSERIDGVF